MRKDQPVTGHVRLEYLLAFLLVLYIQENVVPSVRLLVWLPCRDNLSTKQVQVCTGVAQH